MTNTEKNLPQNPFASDNPIGSVIINLVDAHSKAIAAKLRTIGLYRGQEMLLKAISDCDGCSQNQLATQLCLDHSSITKSITRMEKSGYVERKKSTTDRRITLVKITPAGRDILTQAELIWSQTEQVAAQELSSEEVRNFLQLAQKVTANLTHH